MSALYILFDLELLMIHLDPKQLDDLAQRLDALIPESLQSTRSEVRKTVKACIENLLQHLDVVTREEFDVQAKLLAKTRQRLSELQKRLDALERKEDSENSVS